MAPFYNACWLIAVQSEETTTRISSAEETTTPIFSTLAVLILIFVLAVAVAVVGVGLAIFLVMRANSQK